MNSDHAFVVSSSSFYEPEEEAIHVTRLSPHACGVVFVWGKGLFPLSYFNFLGTRRPAIIADRLLP